MRHMMGSYLQDVYNDEQFFRIAVYSTANLNCN